MLLGTETHGAKRVRDVATRSRNQTTVRRLRPLRRRAARTLRPPLVALRAR
jgi:hypothetical protein